MLESIKQRLGRDDEQGFTLIELMVVVLIIAILLAIAIPTFLSAKKSANARAAQSNLRNALTAEQTYWTDNQSFSNTVATMQGVEPNLNWETSAPTSTDASNSVGVSLPGTSDVLLQAYGKDTVCYAIYQTNGTPISNGTNQASTLYERSASASGACTMPAAPTTFTVGKLPSSGTPSATTWYTSF